MWLVEPQSSGERSLKTTSLKQWSSNFFNSRFQLTLEPEGVFVEPLELNYHTQNLKKNMQITGNHQMAWIVCHDYESIREGYIRNGGKEVKLFTSALKAFQCNNRIDMAQRKHLDYFYVVELLDDWNVNVPNWKYPRNLESHRVSSPGFGNNSKMMVIRSTASDLSRQLSSATGTTVSKQTVYRRLGHIDLYARRPARCVPLTATHCRLRLTWSKEHALWTPPQWSCVMFSDESRFSLQSDSHRALIWRAPSTRYHQENTIE
ncbi:transposable element Tcb1 transposase [Trichonephila clavipes]|nr:transposable element Tcb1 transposase [Trichonephila clavipes]